MNQERKPDSRRTDLRNVKRTRPNEDGSRSSDSRVRYRETHSGRRARQFSRLRSLVVPLDGTPFAEHALPHAIAIARRSGANCRFR